MRTCPLLILVLLLVPADLWAQPRKWASHLGIPYVTAEFIALQGNTVLVRATDGEDYNWSMSGLSRADQLFVAGQHDWSTQHASAPGVKLKSEVAWSENSFLDTEGNRYPTPLIVSVLTAGKPAANASRFGLLKIDTVETDPVSALEQWIHVPGVGPIQKMVDVDRYKQSPAHPQHGLRVNVDFKPPDPPVRTIRRLTGSFQLFTGDRHVITVKNLPAVKDLPLRDTVLSDLYLDIVVSPSDNTSGFQNPPADWITFRVEINGNLKYVQTVEVTDAAGRPFYPTSQFVSSFNDDSTYVFHYYKPIPADAQLRLAVLTNAHEMIVPFEFTDLEVPPQPEASEDTFGFHPPHGTRLIWGRFLIPAMENDLMKPLVKMAQIKWAVFNCWCACVEVTKSGADAGHVESGRDQAQ